MGKHRWLELVLTSVTWPRESTEHQHNLSTISNIARACLNYHVPWEVLIIWSRLVSLVINLHRFSSLDFVKSAKILPLCEITEQQTFQNRIQVLKLGCLIPLTTENLGTVNDIKRPLNAEWAITVARKKWQTEVHRKMSKESFQSFKCWHKRPSTNKLEGLSLLLLASLKSWLGWYKEWLPHDIRIPTPGLSLVPVPVRPCFSSTNSAENFERWITVLSHSVEHFVEYPHVYQFFWTSRIFLIKVFLWEYFDLWLFISSAPMF